MANGPSGDPVIKDLVLVGGGHSHVAVLKRFGMRPLPGVRITLVSRNTETPYSGMLPGLVAGHYTADEAHIDLVPLTRFAGARFLCDEVTGFDPVAKTVMLARRPPLSYDVLSINSGSTPALAAAAGTDETSTPVKPIDGFLARFEALLERIGAGAAVAGNGPAPGAAGSGANSAQRSVPGAAVGGARPRIAVVGGGAGGVELVLSVQRRLGVSGVDAELALLTDTPDVLVTLSARARARFRRILAERGIAVHTQTRAVDARDGMLRTEGGRELEADAVLWVTDAAAPPWIAVSGVAVDERGFLLVDGTLQSVSHADVFAAGDAAAMRATPRPKSGVVAVRQGPVLARNLRRALLGRRLTKYRPQRAFLNLIGTGDDYAVAARGPWSAEGRWVWRWKQGIDRRFMRKYQELPPMEHKRRRAVPAALLNELPPALRDADMRCGGCGAKLGAEALRAALDSLGTRPREDVVVGLEAPGDAALVAVPAGKLAVLSIDGFRPMLDDPYLFGRITANHCLGDLYAVGADAQTALANVTLPLWPEAKLVAELRQMLAGALEELHAAGAELVGGHTGEGAELTLGFAVTGHVAPSRALGKHGLAAGDALVLTKPLGTGTLLAANMHARARGRWIDGAVAAMLQSNRAAVEILRAHGVTACTDVTGFGFACHLLEMVGEEPLDVALDLDALPVLDGAFETLRAGFPSTLHAANERAARAALIDDTLAAHARFALLFDPQTAGGLLAGIAHARAQDCVAALAAAGYARAAVIGRVAGRSHLRPRLLLS